MKFSIINSKDAFYSSERFLLAIGVKQYILGVQVHQWGVRFMLIAWHFCIHFSK